MNRAKMAVVFGHGKNTKAVISTVIVRPCHHESGERIRFSGPVTFDEKSSKHIKDVVLPATDSVLEILDLPKKSFEISVINIGAAAINEIGLKIGGFSADVPVLLAILSASLGIGIPQDIVSTGHIASPDGDIRMVKAIPEKVGAAVKDGSVRCFISPALDGDGSLDSLSPKEKQRATDATTNAKQYLRVVAVHDIGELVKVVFSDEQVVLAAFRLGFYDCLVPPVAKKTPTEKVAMYLAENNEKRFWAILERQLIGGNNDNARELLLALTGFYIYRKTYPNGLGYGLLRLIQSLPPETRRLKLNFPLLPTSKSIQLSQFAQESDHKDVLLLFKATAGEISPQSKKRSGKRAARKNAIPAEDDDKLRFILSEINADALTLIVLPIDSARASYLIDHVITSSYDEFLETITSFYIHLMRHTRRISDPVDLKAAGAEAVALLERAFAKKGGFQAALAEARHPCQGGLRLVLDVLTEQLRKEEEEKHINHVIKSTVAPLDWEAKVALMGKLLRHLEPHLPPKVISQPPERFANHHETIVRTYVQSMNQVKSLFRSF